MAFVTVPAATVGGGLVYEIYPWGEVISGSKQQLQAMGIEPGRPYPGERGRSTRRLLTTDPRGLPAEIWLNPLRPGHFDCCIMFPDRPALAEPAPVAFAAGITLTKTELFDVYEGSGESLVRAGLVLEDQLPVSGSAGRSRVVLLADGRLAGGGRGRRASWISAEGTRVVERAKRGSFVVRVKTSEAESRRRRAESAKLDQEWLAACERLPVPKPLQPIQLRLIHRQEQHSVVAGPAAPRPTTRPSLRLVAVRG